jgi:hypothetical protein
MTWLKFGDISVKSIYGFLNHKVILFLPKLPKHEQKFLPSDCHRTTNDLNSYFLGILAIMATYEQP